MKIAVFLPNWIGDAVMATPAIQALRSHFQGARLVGVLRPYIAGVMEGLNWLDHEIRLNPVGRSDEQWPRVSALLRQQSIDLAILFPNSFHAAWVAWLGRCQRRIGYARYGRSLLLTDCLKPVRNTEGKLIPNSCLDAYNRLVELAGCTRISKQMKLATTPADEAGADRIWTRAGFGRYSEVVCFNPGAAFGAAKHWPVASFAELSRLFRDRRGSGVLVLCGPGEREMARQIVAQSRRPDVFSLADEKLSIGLTKACIRRADLLVTTDSGPRHFAAAFDRPVVTLFGPTHIGWTETYFAKAIHLQKKVDCGPCQQRICPLDHHCMRDLPPPEVFQAAEKLLSQWPAGGHSKAG